MPREERLLKSRRTLADERYDVAMELREALKALVAGYGMTPSLADLSQHRAAELDTYASLVLKAQALFKAQDSWIGPIDYVLTDEDAEAFVVRLEDYRKAILRHALGR